MKRWNLALILTIVVLSATILPLNVNAQGQAISITKSTDNNSASLGDIITYNLTISTGNATAYNVTLEDYKLWPAPVDIGDILPGDNVTLTGNYTVVETDFPGPLTNTANVSGFDQSGNIITDNASSTVTLNPYIASIAVTKTASKYSASATENITYTYVITNTGNVTVDNITLTDNMLGAVDLDDKTLGPGENITATASYTITIDDVTAGSIVNTANVTGYDPLGNPVSATSKQVQVLLNRSLMTKAQILQRSGVPGKGIGAAPGLQKLFNPKSRAAEHAGKKTAKHAEAKGNSFRNHRGQQ